MLTRQNSVKNLVSRLSIPVGCCPLLFQQNYFTNNGSLIRQYSSNASPVSEQQQDISKCPHHHQSPPKPFSEIPGPKGLPIVGNLFELIKNVKKNSGPYFLSLCEEYGDIVKIEAIGKKLIILANPDLLGELYKKEEKRATVMSSRKYKLERGIPLAPIEMHYEESWNETRQLYNIAMKPEFQDQVTIPQLTELNGEFVRRLIKYLKETNDPEKYRLEDGVKTICRYGFDAVLKVFLGVRMSDELTKTFPFDVADFALASIKSLDIIVRLLSKPSLFLYFKTKEYRELEEAYDKSFEYANYLMERFKVVPSEKPRFYEILMERSKNDPNPDILVRSVMNSFLQGALDITIRTLISTLYRLAHHPEYQEKIFQELKEVFGEPTLEEVTSENGLNITKEHYKKLKLTKNFLEEVLRLNSFGFTSSGRMLSKDLELGGYILPKDSQVFAFQRYATIRDEFVPRALEFIPERHEKNSPLAMKSPYVSSPFGVGARKCPGSRIATTELIFAVVNVVRHFTLSHENPEKFPETSFDQALLYIDLEKNPLYLTPRNHLTEYFHQEKLKQQQ